MTCSTFLCFTAHGNEIQSVSRVRVALRRHRRRGHQDATTLASVEFIPSSAPRRIDRRTFHISLFEMDAVIAIDLHCLSISLVIRLSSPIRARISRPSASFLATPRASSRSSLVKPSEMSKHNRRETAYKSSRLAMSPPIGADAGRRRLEARVCADARRSVRASSRSGHGTPTTPQVDAHERTPRPLRRAERTCARPSLTAESRAHGHRRRRRHGVRAQ